MPTPVSFDFHDNMFGVILADPFSSTVLIFLPKLLAVWSTAWSEAVEAQVAAPYDPCHDGKEGLRPHDEVCSNRTLKVVCLSDSLRAKLHK